jgi:periplasmic protein CpxP/Spy
MRWIMLFAVAGTLMTATPMAAHAQRLSPQDSMDGSRRDLEQKFRRRFGELIKERVKLSDAQMSRLELTNRRFEKRRRALYGEERQVREEMRDALSAEESSTVQDRVARLMERALRLQRERLDLLEEEQRELTAFMSPVQRAKYFGMQEQLRRRMEEMRNRPEPEGSDTSSDSSRRRFRVPRRGAVPQPDSVR